MIRLSLFLYLMAVSLAIGAQTCNGTLTAPDSRYAVAANGMTVLDQQTGLIWARCPNGMNWDGAACTGKATTYTWQKALTAADTSTLAGYTDWRLPNVRELASLVEPGCVDPALNTRIFPNTPGTDFWSSSPYVGSVYVAWYVYFNDGYVSYGGARGLADAVRLVRGG